MAIDYSNFKASLNNLETQNRYRIDLPLEFPKYLHEGMAESVIQRFEVCYDTLWKVLRRYLVEDLSIPEVPAAPKPIIRIADQNGLLAAGAEQWMLYVRARINTTHDYDAEKAAEAVELIREFIPDAIGLYMTLTGEPWT